MLRFSVALVALSFCQQALATSHSYVEVRRASYQATADNYESLAFAYASICAEHAVGSNEFQNAWQQYITHEVLHRRYQLVADRLNAEVLNDWDANEDADLQACADNLEQDQINAQYSGSQFQVSVTDTNGVQVTANSSWAATYGWAEQQVQSLI